MRAVAVLALLALGCASAPERHGPAPGESYRLTGRGPVCYLPEGWLCLRARDGTVTWECVQAPPPPD